MKEELKYIGDKIVENHVKLAEKLEDMIDPFYMRDLRNSGMLLNELREYRAELIRCFGEGLFKDTDVVMKEVIKWGEKAASFAIRYNISLSGALRAVSSYRNVIWEAFTEELEQRQFAAITMLDVSKKVDPLIDKVCNVIGEMYEKHNEELMKDAYNALEELSVPVVPLAEGIAIIPIVGDIDTHRAKLIMEISLNASADLNLEDIIFDVSAVPIIDTMVANQLFKIVNALQLTGVETILTGIRPEIAQTIVNLGVNFGEIKTRASMQQALKELGFKKIEDDVKK